MSAKKDNISQIRKYLNGELDARAMHQLEREAQDDPFLMDALEGYEIAGADQEANLGELKDRLAARTAPKKERNLFLWRVLPIAASLILMVGIGYWAFAPKPVVKQLANVVLPKEIKKPETYPVSPAQIAEVDKKPQRKELLQASAQPKQAAPSARSQALAAMAIPDHKITYKTDTVQYNATQYKVNAKTNVDELLKHMEGFEVGADGSVSHQGQSVTKARLNGKDFMSGDVKATTKNLPADIVDKIQVIDDYGDQAAKTGVKDGTPTKILNFTIDSVKNYGLIAAGRAKTENKQLKEVTVVGYGTQMKRTVTGSVATITPDNLSVDKTKKAPDTMLIHGRLAGKIAGLTVENGVKNELNRTITGKVIAKDDGQPLPGVTVTIKGTKTGTQTNINGDFKIEAKDNATLNIAYIGYITQQVAVGDNRNVKVELDASSRDLSEVVITNINPKKVSPLKNPEPADGWKAFRDYLKEEATADDEDDEGTTVKLSFSVAPDGQLSNFHVINGKKAELNDQAIDLIQAGPKWRGASKVKDVTLKIKFHKDE